VLHDPTYIAVRERQQWFTTAVAAAGAVKLQQFESSGHTFSMLRGRDVRHEACLAQATAARDPCRAAP
jgi:hypothetical protein